MTLNERLEKVLPAKYEVRDVFPNGGTVTVAYYTATEYDALLRAFECIKEQRDNILKAANQDGLEYGEAKDWDIEVLKAYEGEK